MSGGGLSDRARAFVPDLIPEPEDIDSAGPLSPKEQQYLDRIHMARDHYGNAKWMRGMALESAFRRRLFRGETGDRSRQEYLDVEWDGMSESAAYREIGEWRLAKRITEIYGRPVADSHVRALSEAAEKHGHEPVAEFYVALRRHGAETGQRVTAEVVENLAEYLTVGGVLPAAKVQPELEALFTPRQVPAPRQGKTTKAGKKDVKPKGVVEPTAVIPKFGNGWVMSAEQINRLSAWIAAEAAHSELDPPWPQTSCWKKLRAGRF
ncbi:type II secretion system F family protein [Streptomyces sp. NPDC055815]